MLCIRFHNYKCLLGLGMSKWSAVQKDPEDITQDNDRGIILDWQLEVKQDIISTFQMALNIFDEGRKTLTQVAQIDGRCPNPENIQNQVGWCSEQPGLLEGVCGTKWLKSWSYLHCIRYLLFPRQHWPLPFIIVFVYLIKRCGNQYSEPKIYNMMDFTRYRT